MKTYLFILFTILSQSLAGQTTFQKVINPGSNGAVENASVQQTSDGGFILLGTMTNNLYLVRTDSMGMIVWKRNVLLCNSICYGSYGYAVQQTADGGFVVVGTIDKSSGGSSMAFWSDIFLYKFDANGNHLWRRELENNTFVPTYHYGFSLALSSDAGFIIGGYFNGGGILIKTDSLGNLAWKKQYAGLGAMVAVGRTLDNGFIAVCNKNVGPGDDDICLIKTDSVGMPVWAKTYGTPGDEIARSVVPVADGGYMVGGATKDAISNYDACLLLTDSLGNLVWAKKYGGLGADYGSASLANDGGFIIAGSTGSFGNGNTDGYLVKTDSLGNTEWSKTYGDTSSEGFGNVIQTIDGRYAAAGFTNSFGNGVYTIKTDTAGNTGCYQTNPPMLTSVLSPAVAALTPVANSFTFFSLSSSPIPATAPGIQKALCPQCTSPQPATVTAMGPTAFCPGGSVLLVASAGASYLWSSNGSGQTENVSAAGSYSVTVTDTSGCTAVSPQIIVNIHSPVIPLITSVGALLSSSPAVSYQWYFNGMLISGANAPTYTTAQDGTYRVETTDTNGCIALSAPYSFILSAEDATAGRPNLYPNPTTGFFTIQAMIAGELTIMDVQGRRVLKFAVLKGSNSYSMPPGCPSGVYFASFVTITGNVYRVRMLLER